jgi:RiboL-PSP-HEPN
MTARSLAWRAYLDRLREVAQLLRADPASRYGKGHIAPVALTSEQVRLSVALSRGALVLTCSHLQGYFSSVLQEFLEQLDGSGVDVARLPKELKAELCLRFPYPDSLKDKPRDQAELLHRTYSPLWRDGTPLPAGTIRTGSLTDPSANPWPASIASLLRTAGVDVFEYVRLTSGVAWVTGIKTNVRELVQSRNKVAHGDDTVSVTADDVRRLMQWATRLARAADATLGAKLGELTNATWQNV